MSHYIALFKKTTEGVEVEFPDLKGCATFGDDWEEAFANAKDALAGWMAYAEPQFVKAPSKHDDLAHLQGELVPIALDEKTKNAYRQLKRFNVIFPIETIERIDFFRKKLGLKRSTFLKRAGEEYLKHHNTNL